MNWRNLLPIGFGVLGTVAITLTLAHQINSPPRTSEALAQPVTPSPASQQQQQQQRRHKITVKVAEVADLQVKEGQRVQRTNIIADRGRERRRLNAQKRQLELTLNKLKLSQITPPNPPRAVPVMRSLPPASYLEQEAAVEAAQAAIAKAESDIEAKKQMIQYLSELPNLDPLVMEHEQAKLAQLQQAHTAAVKGYQLAAGKLQTAKQGRAYREYEASLDAARRVEEANQAQLNYQRQVAEYEQRLRTKEFQLAQVHEKLQGVENAIANLAVVRSPYDGRVRKIRDLGQSPDGLITFEVTLLVRSSAGK